MQLHRLVALGQITATSAGLFAATLGRVLLGPANTRWGPVRVPAWQAITISTLETRLQGGPDRVHSDNFRKGESHEASHHDHAHENGQNDEGAARVT